MWMPQLMIEVMMQWTICIRTKIAVGDFKAKFGLKNTLKSTTGTSLHKITNCSSFGVKGLIFDIAKITGAQGLHVQIYISNCYVYHILISYFFNHPFNAQFFKPSYITN
jgi:hypothetical protein